MAVDVYPVSAVTTVEESGTILPQRTYLNFANGIIATDDSGNNETDVSLDYATPAIVLGTAAAAGSSAQVIRADGTIVAFDATVPAALGAAATGSVAFAARRDHVHPTTNLALLNANNAFSGTGTTTFAGDVQARRVFAGGAVTAAILLGAGGTHPDTATTLYGIYSQVAFPSTTTVQATVARLQVETAAAAWTASLAEGLRVAGPIIGAASAITELHGIRVIGQGFIGSVTTGYGITVDRAKTAALWLGADGAGTAVTGGIVFGSGQDANLYRFAANVLGSTSGLRQTLAADVIGLEMVANASQTAKLMNVINSGATRTYFGWDPEVAHNESATYFASWSSAVTAGLTAGFRHDLNLLPAGASATSQYNLFVTSSTGSSQNFTGDQAGMIGQVNWASTGTHSTGVMVGTKGAIQTAASAGTVTTAYGVLGAADIVSGTTITSMSMLKATTPGSSGSVTNMYGLWVDPLDKGGTLSVGARIDVPTGGGSKYCLWLSGDSDSTVAAGGITIGSSKDTNLYRSAADTLKTDDAFVASTVTDGTVLVLKQTVIPFSKGGTLATGAGTFRFYIDGGNWTIIQVRASVGTAPTGATLIVDVNKNGTTIFTTQGRRPTIAISGFTATPSAAIEVTSLTTADYLSVDIDQIGSTVAGADLVVTVWLQRA